MRRAEREVTSTADILKMMESCSVCSLAFAAGDCPYVVPVNFGVDAAAEKLSLYIHGAAEGTKIDLMKNNNRVAFCMTCDEVTEYGKTPCSTTMRYRSVCGQGRISLVEEFSEKVRGLACVMGQLDKQGKWEYDFDEKAVEKIAVLKISVEQITGKINQKIGKSG